MQYKEQLLEELQNEMGSFLMYMTKVIKSETKEMDLSAVKEHLSELLKLVVLNEIVQESERG